MNFYTLSSQLKVDVQLLFLKYKELFPDIKIYDYTIELRKHEIELLKKIYL